jgi:hypothetical protein
MSLELRPHNDGAPDDFQVVHGGLEIVRIYQKKVTLAPGARWLPYWTDRDRRRFASQSQSPRR